ncbi:MAG TPA: hypothetical protein VEP90_05720 [Methylomirabilota bacterium]|nr:hypothetical protein [Methylomirabilota bacterium]
MPDKKYDKEYLDRYAILWGNPLGKDCALTIANMIEGYTPADIRLHAGEMTAQEMRTVKTIQKWWVAEIRQFANKL